MPDKDLAVAEKKSQSPKENQDIDGVVDLESDEESSSSVSGASVDGFPIEGESEWVGVMRGMALTIFALILITAAVFHFLTADDGFVEIQQLGMMMGGLVFLLIVGYFFFLMLVIPRQADYGRYIINKYQVNFYLLTPTGLSIRPVSETVKISKFMGLTTGRMTDKKGKVSYAVYLVHATNKGKTINIKSFPDVGEADEYAEQLGRALRLNVVTSKGKKATAKART